MSARKARALVLLSGGLDSLLAVKVLQAQGIEVVGLSFVTPFFGAGKAKRSAADLGIDLIVEDITDAHLELVKNPPRGYGKQMNPCIDCHTLMVKRAGEIMERDGFDFVATGEVLGERPMSQNYGALMDVARDSGYGDYLLRPLSARRLPETAPERESMVDRSRLLDFEGRSRKPQMALAESYGVTSYVQPAGGCLLTDPAFSARLKELLEHDPDAGPWDMALLKVGRHFRLGDGTKVVVGRNEEDNRRIEGMARSEDALFITLSVPGPASLVVGGGDLRVIGEAAKLTASHGDASAGMVEMQLKAGGEERTIQAAAGDRAAWKKYRI